MEYATRTSAATAQYIGEKGELLGKSAWSQNNAQEQTWPVGRLRPNDLGFFNMQGNVYTWCQERHRPYPTASEGTAVEDQEDELGVDPTDSRLLRGGSFYFLPSLMCSAYRNHDLPTYRYYLSGIRPARTLGAAVVTLIASALR